MMRAILFDFFGVFRTDGFDGWLKHHGFERETFLEVTQKHDRGEYNDKEFFQAVAEASGVAAEQVEKRMEAGNELNRPLVDYVRTLQGKYKLGLLSNATSEYLRRELARYDLEKYFDEIVISSEVGLIKPEVEAFEHTLRKLAVKPWECIFTDDNPANISAAKKLGMHGVVFTGVPELKKQVTRILAAE